MDVCCAKLASESAHDVVFVVGGNRPDKRARAVGAQGENVKGTHCQWFSVTNRALA